MSKKLFVGNLPFDVNDADLIKVFNVVGKVANARVVTNRKTGRSKGFAFVEMDTEELAKEAVRVFEGATLNERAITVQVSTPKNEAEANAESSVEAAPKKPIQFNKPSQKDAADSAATNSEAPASTSAAAETTAAEKAPEASPTESA